MSPTPRTWRQIARRDLATLAIHWTRTRPAVDDFLGEEPQPARDAADILDDILRESRLLGGTGHIRGGHTCVCFTEAPLAEMASMFAIAAVAEDTGALRYEPFGVGVSKQWLFESGGRPAIYQSDAEYEQLPVNFRWRHCRYEPPDIDFTWEREWRIPADELALDPDQTWIFVPTEEIARDLAGQRPGWRIAPLELFGLPGVV